MEQAEILRQLEERLREAQRRRDQASAHFDEVIRGIPSGAAYPDNVERIQRASKEYSSAIQAVEDALNAQNDFVLHGVRPAVAGDKNSASRKRPDSERPPSTGEKVG